MYIKWLVDQNNRRMKSLGGQTSGRSNIKRSLVETVMIFFGLIFHLQFNTSFHSFLDTISVNCNETVIMGKYGSTIVLPCWISPETDAETLEIRWYRPEQFKNPILFYQNRKIITSFQEMYISRSSLTTRNSQSTGLKQGDVSLKLDNLGLSDIGIFHCYVSGDESYDENTVKLNLTGE